MSTMFPEAVRYESTRNPEPDQASTMFTVQIVGEETGTVYETFTTDDPGRDEEAFREANETTFEERYAPFGPAWQREREAEAGCR